MPMAISQSFVFMGEITGHQNYVTLKFQDEGDRAISVEWKKPIKCIESRKEHYAYSKHKGLGKLKGGEQPNHRATSKIWTTKDMMRAEAETECQTVKPSRNL